MGIKGKDIATLWAVGRMRPGPGTWGSAVALLPGGALVLWVGPLALVVAILALLPLALWAAHAHAKATGQKDASEVVIDEVAGQWVALLAATDSMGIVVAFVLFRAFDIFKPWPISWAEQRLHGAWGVVGDDLLAGFAAGFCILGMRFFIDF